MIEREPGSPEAPGAPPGMDAADRDARTELGKYLGLSTFPGDAERLTATARENNAPDQVLGWLERLPRDRTYRNVQDVARDLGWGVEERRV